MLTKIDAFRVWPLTEQKRNKHHIFRQANTWDSTNQNPEEFKEEGRPIRLDYTVVQEMGKVLLNAGEAKHKKDRKGKKTAQGMKTALGKRVNNEVENGGR